MNLAEATGLVVDWLLGMREMERSRETENSSLSCWGRMRGLDLSGEIHWIRQSNGTFVSRGGDWIRCP